MKKWNAPEIAELNITETANGFFHADFETTVLFNDKGKNNTKPGDDSNENDVVNSLS